MEEHQAPSLRHLTSPTFGIPPEKPNPVLESLGTPHIESFNWMLSDGFELVTKYLEPLQFELPDEKTRVSFSISDLKLHRPAIHQSDVPIKSVLIRPSECRQRAETYKGLFTAKLSWTLNGDPRTPINLNLGEIPVMVKSKACHLSDMSPRQLVNAGEEEDCWGGFFIIKGHERLVRMLISTRRNFPVALQRGSWKNRGPSFSDLGIVMRCVSEDLRSVNNVVHFLLDGSCKFMFSHERTLCFVPVSVMLRALSERSDLDIFHNLLHGAEDDQYYQGCLKTILRQAHDEKVHTKQDALKFLGSNFRYKFRRLPTWYTDEEVGEFIIRRSICIHLENDEDKFECICEMVRKLYALVQNRIKTESADSVMMHEALLGGNLYMQVIGDKLEKWLILLKSVMTKRIAAKGIKNYHLNQEELEACIKRCGTFESSMANFLATGNLATISGLGLMQDKGLTIVAENINRMRYMSHFRAIHRGSFFQEMRTTDARQLLPDAWGFICPVHTPDGTPCGLLNHLAKNCIVTTAPEKIDELPEILRSLGVVPIEDRPAANNHYFVHVDGRVMGVIKREKAQKMTNTLRLLKIEGKRISSGVEICLIEKEEGVRGQYPGIYIFSGAARFMRRVLHIATRKIEMLGSLEQVRLQVAVRPKEVAESKATHLELSPTAFLSLLANLIPMPDCNQSPRNMYQCQMGKQSMGNPTHAWRLQAETKLYRLLTPAAPLFRTAHYDSVNLDNNAMGLNAIVAVISYTGYDMEDAMIINKSSYERGLGHGSIYKSEFIDLTPNSYFALDPTKPELTEFLDHDGLPFIGCHLQEGDPIACSYDMATNTFKVHRHHSKEEILVDNVRLCGVPQTRTRGGHAPRVCITFRVPRNPTVGDKFASRAGQKGICSRKWPTEDLPFTESGLTPDIVFNPHGFPSRMTIAMMIELMAGKSAAVHGRVHDATPFRFSEQDTAIDYFGKMLVEAGYSYYGTERMYSGVTGQEMEASIFFGVCYYQRLRHMVSDKWQVRSVGPVDPVMRQPVKGRRRGGGVRFGEMERDSIISHGASFLLQDRLFHCSDKSQTMCCTKCGSVLSVCLVPSKLGVPEAQNCRVCGPGAGEVKSVELPHSLRYLAAQLASVNISLKLELTR
ncbi:DNA-directed RNA polymerase I subunit RPA2 [Neocloeon triangulifer]|uniref:DNA-directed RNA polymerase I subunit RPA2 n=1 Tax=Neocloeon triangulifer TaxID=2078957 RepID=UPI00286ECB0E|nr:DNA-directed RNA polymerase I subunit RPA2 [Neocloeon triangulifer]